MFENRPLLDYFPNVLQDVQEFKMLAIGEEPEFNELWGCLGCALDDQFVMSLTEYGVLRWEKILKIVPKATYTLEERKFMILTRLTVQLPYSIRMLQKMLSELCGPDNFEIQLDKHNYRLSVRLEGLGDTNAGAVAELLRRICPANLFCEVTHASMICTSVFYLGAALHSKAYTFTSSEIIKI